MCFRKENNFHWILYFEYKNSTSFIMEFMNIIKSQKNNWKKNLSLVEQINNEFWNFKVSKIVEKSLKSFQRYFESLGFRHYFSLSRHPCFLQSGHFTQRARSVLSLWITVIKIFERYLEWVCFVTTCVPKISGIQKCKGHASNNWSVKIIRKEKWKQLQ